MVVRVGVPLPVRVVVRVGMTLPVRVVVRVGMTLPVIVARMRVAVLIMMVGTRVMIVMPMRRSDPALSKQGEADAGDR